jgi:alpha-mannosidase
VKSVLRVETEYGGSRLVQDVTMYGRLDRIDVDCTVTWNERWRALKLRFPVAVEDPVATYEVAYGTLERPTDGREVPGQRWVDVSGRAPDGGGVGLSLLNDSKYSYDAMGPAIGLTILRSPVYAHHEPFLPLPEGHYVWQDQGTQHFRYALLPHAGDWRAAGTPRAAAELNEHAVCLVETSHEGDLPARLGFVHVVPEDVVVTALKRAEDGDDLIVRLFETTGRARTATLRLPSIHRDVDVTLRGGELKTLLVPLDRGSAVREVDLLERLAPV